MSKQHRIEELKKQLTMFDSFIKLFGPLSEMMETKRKLIQEEFDILIKNKAIGF
jgi:hypothetical protein